MADTLVTSDVTTPTLYVCHIDAKMPRLHPCAKAHAALEGAGIAHDKIVYGKGRPFGIGAAGTRGDLERVSGQEKLPVLVLPGGETVSGSGSIVRWAREHAG
ncbi:glutathione S-transferase N-terminal domain-containing protein [Patulibacter sp.]|uniref:glutathione S-transferase N-terminal domain-containing protein n=1 Tax=Patulibacter sp. TaxID=1912859 RepID=UPI0027228AE2|nr:glutathione S-transferase N-terminal domain-containing protein [Patulibacter sp.]MDO9410673.1 glutathione S-transferase N-terminal domain-containing protein [Patulibacter sp.]